jgi:Rab3 GTPase-activating protein catalytic subunit
MLNCCINHKKNKESGPPPEVDTTFGGEEDEFFDATETAVEEEVPLKQHSAWNQPQGRKDRTKMRLLRSGEFLYNPVTQDGCPMTEDMIIEMTEMMEQLGQDSEGSELRARILSASLLSDMESFKVYF